MRRDYYYNEFVRLSQGDLMCSHEAIDHMVGGINTMEKLALRSELLHGDVKLAKRQLGQQLFCTSDSANRRLYVWKFVLKSGIVWQITGGNGRGTSYEYALNDGCELRDIFNELLDKLEVAHGTNFRLLKM